MIKETTIKRLTCDVCNWIFEYNASDVGGMEQFRKYHAKCVQDEPWCPIGLDQHGRYVDKEFGGYLIGRKAVAIAFQYAVEQGWIRPHSTFDKEPYLYTVKGYEYESPVSAAAAVKCMWPSTFVGIRSRLRPDLREALGGEE